MKNSQPDSPVIEDENNLKFENLIKSWVKSVIARVIRESRLHFKDIWEKLYPKEIVSLSVS